MREIARLLAPVPGGLPIVLDAVRHAARQTVRLEPSSPDLRDWQHLALDLEAALRKLDVDYADQAEALALEMRSAVTMAVRNPPRPRAIIDPGPQSHPSRPR